LRGKGINQPGGGGQGKRKRNNDMQIARVIGTVVSTNKSEKLHGMKLLLTRIIDLDTWTEKGAPVVSIDAVGAGEGEVVMVVGGSSARQTTLTDNKPADSTIIAIIDYIDMNQKRIFDKHKEKD
jgi:ethanolamine utilization protein EutN/carbon dioxide concentrating mechanism protein CcmL